MTAGVQQYTHGSIGRMFARQNVPSVYGRQKLADETEPPTEAGLVDQVSLSPNAPKPLTADFLKDALDAGDTLASGNRLSEESSTRLRQDRVFAAVSALALMGHDGEQPAAWPGGIPAPNRAELEAARRRLAQRPQNADQTTDAATVQNRRIELLEKIGRRDFGQLPPGIPTTASKSPAV